MRSVAKHSYISAGRDGKGRASAHIRYIQFRQGDDKDKRGGARWFFNADRDQITGFEIRKQIAEQSERGVVMHKIILSPGMNGVDMEDYTRALMEELGRSKGLELEYFATVHRNTEHDHAHVVIMGQDRNGRNVFMKAKHDYTLLRDVGDRYLERYHFYERYLDQEIPKLMKGGYVRDKGDQSFELMIADLKSVKSIEELDKERIEQRREKLEVKFDKEHAVANLPEEEKIHDNRRVYTKHDRLEELEDYAERLKNGEAAWLPIEQYKMLWSWIGTKKTAGDDFYERTGENERLQQQFDEDLKRSLETASTRPKGFRQFIFESRGRLLESHEQYEIMTSRHGLKKELKELEDGAEPEHPERRKEIEDQLKWLDELLEERQSEKGRPAKKGEAKLSPEKAKEADKQKSEVEEPRAKADARVRADDAKGGVDKEGKGDQEALEKDDRDTRDQQARDKDNQDKRDQEARDKDDQDRRDQEARDKDDQDRRDQEARDKDDQDRRDQQARDKDDQDRRDEEARDKDDRDRRDQEDRIEQDRREEEARDWQRKAERETREEADRVFKLQQELAKLRAQELEQGQPAKDGTSSKFQEKIDQYEQEIADAGKHVGGAKREFGDSERGILDQAQPQLDLEKGIEDNWQLDQKAGPQEHDIDELLSDLDKLDEQEHQTDFQDDISSILFGDNPEHGLDAYEKTAEERRIESWEQNAFNAELIQMQQDRPDQQLEKTLGDEVSQTDVGQQISAQQQEQQMQEQIAQAVQLQIQQTFFQPEKSEEKDEHEHEEKDKDDGGEHGR